MKRVQTLALITLLAMLGFVGTAHAETISAEEYRAKTIAFFKEIVALRSSGYFWENPGGFGEANEAAHDWSQRLGKFWRETDVPDAYGKFIYLPSGDVVTAGHLFEIQSAIAFNDYDSLEKMLPRFWLAIVCVENKGICDKYIQGD